MAPKLPWFRLYTEIMDDPKLANWTGDQFRVLIYLFCLARESEEPGLIMMTPEEIAWRTRQPVELVLSVLELCQAGKRPIVTPQEEGFLVEQFLDRQYDKPSDQPGATRERKQRQRDSEKSHANVTPMSRDVTRYKQTNRQTTDTDTDTDTDLKDQTTGQSPAAGPPAKNSDLIAELVENYRAVPGITPAKGDFAFIGALYNEHGYEQVLSAINKLQMAVAVQQIEKPLVYLKGILKNRESSGKPRAPTRLPRAFASIQEAVERMNASEE